MDRHLSTYELATLSCKQHEALLDAAYIDRHAKECPLCRDRVSSVLGPAFLKERVAGGTAPLFDGKFKIGQVFLPQFIKDVNVVPECTLPIVVVSEPRKDNITGREIVDVMNMHDYPGLAAQSDLYAQPSDGSFDGWVICLWSLREVLVDVLPSDGFQGILGKDTSSFLQCYLKKEKITDHSVICARTLGGNATPQSQLRRRMLHDYQTLTDDLFGRRDWKIRVLDMAAYLLPEVEERRDPSLVVGLDELLARVSGMQPGGSPLVEFFDEKYQHECERNAPNCADSQGLLALALLESERYVRTGDLRHRSIAREIIPETVSHAAHEKREARRQKTANVLDVFMARKAGKLIAEYVAKIQLLVERPTQLAAAGGYLGTGQKKPKTKAAEEHLGWSRTVERYDIKFKVVFVDDKTATLDVEIEDRRANALPAMRALIFKKNLLHAMQSVKSAPDSLTARGTASFRLRKDNYIVRLMDGKKERVSVAISMLPKARKK